MANLVLVLQGQLSYSLVVLWKVEYGVISKP
ncbi:uncharacterized protein METZ01_LOCUS235277, partial [marine metagenome]